MSKHIILCFALFTVGHCWPTAGQLDLARTEEGDPLPEGAQIPDNGTFLEKHQTVKNGIIQGQYSYFDPEGSLVVVKYTMDKDGKNYSEKRLLTINYDDSDQKQTPSLSEEELIDRVIEKLRPQIVELVKGKSSEVSSVPASDFLTPMSQSAFGYLSSKFNKFEYILSQIMCDLMTSNIDPKNLKTENELISTIVFKIFTLLPEGTLLTYAKKLSRHARETFETNTEISDLDESTTIDPLSDNKPFDNFITLALLKLFAVNNETNISVGINSNTSSENFDLFEDHEAEEIDSEYGGFVTEILKNLLGTFGSSETNEVENPVTDYLKQILFSGTTSSYTTFLELFYDVEALFKMYMREATCSSIPGKNSPLGVSKKAVKKPQDVDDNKEELTTLIKAKVSNLIHKKADFSPLEDEQTIESILNDVTKTNKLEDVQSFRSQIIEEIHNRRLELYKEKPILA